MQTQISIGYEQILNLTFLLPLEEKMRLIEDLTQSIKQNNFTKTEIEYIDIFDNNEAYLISESSLAVDWNRPEEDEAWAYLNEMK